mgnify:CR=1 FL=1
MSYATIDDLREYLGLTESDHDALLDRLLDSAQKYIETQTGRTFEASADSTRYLDASAILLRDLWLDADLCAITSVTNGDSVVIAGTNYTTRPRNLTPYYALRMDTDSAYAWDGTTGEIAIVGKWAYSTTAPYDIQQATIRLAGWLYRQRDNAGEGDRPIIAGNATVLPSRMPADIEALIAPYRVRV